MPLARAMSLPVLPRVLLSRRALMIPQRRLALVATVRPHILAWQPAVLRSAGRGARMFATEQPTAAAADADAAAEDTEQPAEGMDATASDTTEGGAAAEAEEDPMAALKAELENEQAERVAAEAKTEEYKDAMLRALADAENARQIARRDVDNARKYGVQNFAKDILDVADNLERAMGTVPEAMRMLGEDPSGSETALVSLYEGVNMTEKQMQSIMGRFGIKKIDPLGEKLDPNRHDVKVNLPAGSGACSESGCPLSVPPPPLLLTSAADSPGFPLWGLTLTAVALSACCR
jgi:molecular chaperone GrpE